MTDQDRPATDAEPSQAVLHLAWSPARQAAALAAALCHYADPDPLKADRGRQQKRTYTFAAERTDKPD
ncbi:hypothetical protein GCM10010124_09130 [Pilimelia terevasa]|uniref:Uncharacterized protein n=1 Tax=Pilimelia terevasa TaxID=53372 RepID=A0A8J3BL00_9ACTN|nr:hypothetical protein GCM10010124_09130 [Pilimelia terevasa]